MNKEKRISENGIIPLELNKKDFDSLMNIYEKALNQTFDTLTKIKGIVQEVFGYEIINSISKRIKTHDSIINKMQKKNNEINLENMIENINDIAGIRITCPIKNNIYTVLDIIKKMPNIKVLQTKDYISEPKKSGYSGYHLIIETPVKIGEQEVPVKVEIQIRTMAMDFWATNEHRVRYKSNSKLSILDSHKLTMYAKIINVIDDKIMEIYDKQKLA